MRTLESYDELPLAGLRGFHWVTKSINASVNWANEAHLIPLILELELGFGWRWVKAIL